MNLFRKLANRTTPIDETALHYIWLSLACGFASASARELIDLSIVYSGKTLKPLRTRRGLVFIESRYLAPVSDVLDVLELYERFTPSGTPYIVAKAGFLLQAVIMPFDVISQQFVERLQELTEQCAVSLDLRQREAERRTAAEPEQCSLNVDRSAAAYDGRRRSAAAS